MFKGMPTYITSAHAELGLLLTFLELLKRKNRDFTFRERNWAMRDSVARKKKKKEDSQLLFWYLMSFSSRYTCVVHIWLYIWRPTIKWCIGLVERLEGYMVAQHYSKVELYNVDSNMIFRKIQLQYKPNQTHERKKSSWVAMRLACPQTLGVTIHHDESNRA